MKIIIELDHTDIVNSSAPEFEALFTVIQMYAKTVKLQKEIVPKVFSDELKKQEEKHRAQAQSHFEKNSTAEKNSAVENSAEKNFNRAEIEAEIKKIALDKKESGASKKIKEFIQSYGVEKLSEVPDEKIIELLEKVRGIE